MCQDAVFTCDTLPLFKNKKWKGQKSMELSVIKQNLLEKQ